MLDLLEDHFSIMRHFLREITGSIVDGWQRLPPGHAAAVNRQASLDAERRRDLDLVERIFFLRQVVPFARASINALAELARGLSEIHLAPGARLWSEGEAGAPRGAGRGRRGRMRLARRLPAERRAGIPLGALESIAGRPRFYEAEVTSPLTGLAGEIEMLFDVFEDNLDMAIQFLRR